MRSPRTPAPFNTRAPGCFGSTQWPISKLDTQIVERNITLHFLYLLSFKIGKITLHYTFCTWSKRDCCMLLVVVMVFEYACLSLWLVSMSLQNSSIQMSSPRFAPSSIRFWTSRAKDTRIYGPDDSSFQHTSNGSRVWAEAGDFKSNFFFSNLCHVTCWLLIQVLQNWLLHGAWTKSAKHHWYHRAPRSVQVQTFFGKGLAFFELRCEKIKANQEYKPLWKIFPLPNCKVVQGASLRVDFAIP